MLREAQASTLAGAYFWGVLWGFGGLTFGLTMRYLGMSLGMAVVLGYCAAFGTLMPPIFDGSSARRCSAPFRGALSWPASASAWRGSRSRARPECPKKARCRRSRRRSRSRSSTWEGVIVATFSGVMSACFSYGLRAGDPSRRSLCGTARPRSGRACRCWCRCCWAASPPISSGA